MQGKSHLTPVGIAQHIIQRSDNGQVCFDSDEDIAVYIHWLYEASRRFQVRIHAWVFMTNHIHLLATPMAPGAVSKMMQNLCRRYLYYFNHTYDRTGDLWEDRFKFCLVEDGHYILHCQRYIELHPVTAGIVDDPVDYQWSSYRAHALGAPVKLSSPHELYLTLGDTPDERQKQYRGLFKATVNWTLISKIRDAVSEGLVLGTDKFKEELCSI